MNLEAEISTIRNAPLFKGLCASKSRLLACMSEQLVFDAGEYICHQGEIPDAAYLIIDGEVEYLIDTPQGEKAIGSDGKCTIIGEVSILCNTERFASVRAVSPVSVMRIGRETLLQMMQENAELSLSIARELAKRVMKLTERATTEIAH